MSRKAQDPGPVSRPVSKWLRRLLAYGRSLGGKSDQEAVEHVIRARDAVRKPKK